MSACTTRFRAVAAVALGLVLLPPVFAGAAVLRVPTDFRTITLALAATQAGDTVRVVGNGGATYPERVIIARDVTIQGGWRADFQVHDPRIYVSVVRDTSQFSADRSVIRIDGSPRVVIEGLTVIGGRLGVEAAGGADLVIRDCEFRGQKNSRRGFGDQAGAAIHVDGGTLLAEGLRTQNGLSAFAGASLAVVGGASATVRDCFFTLGTSLPFNPPDAFDPAPGGGILVKDSFAVLERVQVVQCAAQLNAAGGLYATASTVDLRDCDFRQCFSPVEGGAIRLVDCPRVTLSNCRLEANLGRTGAGLSALRVADLQLAGCRIAGNRAGTEGAGLWIDSSTFTMTGDTLSANNSPGANDVQRGGGVRVQSSSGLVENTLFLGERAIGGGGAWMQVGGDVVFRGCELRGNTSGFYGGATHIELGGKIRMEGCLVADNVAKFGGGCSASFTAQLEIDHCTFTGNSVQNSGASFYLDTDAQATISNTIACCSPAGGQISCSASTAVVTYSDFWNDDAVNIRAEYSGACPDVTGSSGNIKADPVFCTGDPAFLLSGASPCLGAASDGGDIGWGGPGCARALNLQSESWGRIKSRYGTPR